MRRLFNLLCVLELALFILLPLVAWMASVMGADVNNLVSEEALRWFFRHGSQMLSPNHLALLILFLVAVGALQESLLLSHLHVLFFRRSAASSSCSPHRKALVGSLLFFLVLLILQVLPALLRIPAVLSVSGRLFPSSPWLSGFPLLFCVSIFLTSLVYATASNRIRGIDGLAHLATHGISRYAILIADVMMGGLIYHIIKYCLS